MEPFKGEVADNLFSFYKAQLADLRLMLSDLI